MVIRFLVFLIGLGVIGCSEQLSYDQPEGDSVDVTTIRFPIMEECKRDAVRILSSAHPDEMMEYKIIKFDMTFDAFPSNYAYVELSSGFKSELKELDIGDKIIPWSDKERLVSYANAVHSECDYYFSEMFLRYANPDYGVELSQ